MKRSKLLFVAVLSLLLSLVAACSGTHLHSFSEWSITTDPTMEATGVYSQSCACGVVVEKEIPALSDTEVWTVEEHVDPTHLVEGKDVYVSEYGKVTVSIAVIPHDFEGAAYTITVEPTLIKAGEATHTCIECGHVETVMVPVLAYSAVWSVEKVPSTHLVKGSATYTSVYGTVVVELDFDPTHSFGNVYTITKAPTTVSAGIATHVCECGEVEEVEIPALSDSDVWAVTTVPANHKEEGLSTYTSIYGTVEVVLPVVPHDAYGEYVITTEPTLTATGEAYRVCSCNHIDYATVPALKDSVWTVATEKAPNYNEQGLDVYTSIYGTVKVATAKTVAPYDSKSYSSFNLDASNDEDGYKNGALKVDTVWSKATITLDATATGFGSGYPFRGAHKFFMVNAETGEILICEYEQAWEEREVEVEVEGGWETETQIQKVYLTDEEGNPIYNWETPVSSYTAWVDMATGLIVAPRLSTFNDINVYTPYEVGFAAGEVVASSWDNAIALEYSIGSQNHKIFVYNSRAYFGVSFRNLSGIAVSADACYNQANVHVYDANGALIAGFANNGEKLVVADGKEGTYSGDLGSIFLSGCGNATVAGEVATYEIAGETIALYVANEYYELTLNGNAYTAVKPMVTITFDAGTLAIVEAITANKNIAVALPVLTSATHTFKGWYLDSACENAVPAEFIPTKDVTLYALWKEKVEINIVGVMEGDVDSALLGEGDVIGNFLPVYGVEESIGKVFRGWYLDAGFEVSLPEEAAVTPEDTGITVYAKWEELPTYYGTYKGGEVWNASSGNSGGKTLTIDENGNISGQYTGIVVGYNEETQVITWKKSANDAQTYQIIFNKEVGFMAIGYYGQVDLKNDYYFYSKYSLNGKVNAHYGVKTAPVEGTTSRGYYARLVNVAGPNGDVELFIYGNAIYSNFTATDATGNALTASTLSKSKVLVVKANGETIVSVASEGASFSANNNTVDLDAYFGTYANGDETVVLDGVGGITYGDKSGSYALSSSADYGFDVYLENNTEYYQLTLNGEAFTMVKPMVTITFNAGEYATVEAVEVNANVAYVLPAPTHETNVFNGWFYDAECTNPVGESIVTAQSVTIHALWKVKLSLTVVYNNGEVNGEFTYSQGDVVTLDTPAFAKHAFAGWFTTEDFAEGSEWANGSAIEANTVIYAKWETAPIYNNTYASIEIELKSYAGGIGGVYSRKTVVEIDPYGKAPKGTSWPFNNPMEIKNYNAETGYLELHVIGSYSTSIYRGYIDAVTGIMILSDTNGLATDFYEPLFLTPFETNPSIYAFTTSYWNNGEVRAIDYTVGENVYRVFISGEQVYFNISFVDANGAVVSAADCFGKDTLFVNDANGALIAKFGFDGENMQEMDGYEGTYTTADSNVVTVNGVRVITIGEEEGLYTLAGEGATYTLDAYVGGSYYEVTLNKEGYVAVVNKPMVTITFNAGEYATVEAITVNKNIVINLVQPENDAYIFRGWYLDAECTTIVANEYTPVETLTLYAKWDAKVVLTVVYGNGLENAVLYYGVGDVTAPVTPAYTNGMVFDGWYLDAECTIEYTVGAISESTTIYAKWKEAVAMFGDYLGYNLFGAGNKSTSYISTKLSVTVDGKVSGNKTGTISGYNAKTNTATLTTSSASAYVYYNSEVEILAFDYYAKNATSLSTDMWLFFKNGPKSVEVSDTLCATGFTKLVKVTNQDGSSYVILVHNEQIHLVSSWETTDGTSCTERYVMNCSSFVATLSNGTVLTFTKDGGKFVVA